MHGEQTQDPAAHGRKPPYPGARTNPHLLNRLFEVFCYCDRKLLCIPSSKDLIWIVPNSVSLDSLLSLKTVVLN